MHGIWDKLRWLSRELWVRMALIGALSFIAVVAAKFFDGIIPDGLSEIFGAEGLDRLLDLIANSMLTVTTFSVTVMVTVYFNASNNWTPRAHQVILEDRATQTVLATFLGAYLYALVGIVLLETPYFGEREVVVLYLMTILVLAIIVFTLARWILRLQSFGSLADTAQRMEASTIDAFKEFSRSSTRWAQPLEDGPPEGARPVPAHATGYIKSKDYVLLQRAAEAHDAEIWLTEPTGRFVAAGAPLAHTVGGSVGRHAELDATIQKQIAIGPLRSVDQDPRFGLIQLAEIGSKALSPGVNDPGTAIEVAIRLARILMTYDPSDPEDVIYDRLYVVPLDPDDLMSDAFAPMSRDAAAQIEAHLAVLKAVGAIYEHGAIHLRNAALERGRLCYQRAKEGLSFASDLAKLDEMTPEAFKPVRE